MKLLNLEFFPSFLSFSPTLALKGKEAAKVVHRVRGKVGTLEWEDEAHSFLPQCPWGICSLNFCFRALAKDFLLQPPTFIFVLSHCFYQLIL